MHPPLLLLLFSKIDEKFQCRTEGERNWRKRNKPKAIKEVLRIVTFGRYDPQGTRKVAPGDPGDPPPPPAATPSDDEAEKEAEKEEAERKQVQAKYDELAEEKLGAPAIVRCYSHALLVSMTFGLVLKLTSCMCAWTYCIEPTLKATQAVGTHTHFTCAPSASRLHLPRCDGRCFPLHCACLPSLHRWFLVRTLISIPLYCCVPRLFYLEWIVHFYQKRCIDTLDYPKCRPAMPIMAPFFFGVYLPSIGIRLPGLALPSAEWPDFDWPDIQMPPLRLPSIALPDLQLLLRMRFPNVQWPELPDVAWPGLPSISLGDFLAQLKLKFPTLSWPALPDPSVRFPDFNLPGIDLNILLPQLQLRFPDLAFPVLPELSLPDFSLPELQFSSLLGLLQLRFPALQWPSFSLPSITLPDLQLVLSLRLPDVQWPTLPSLDLSLPNLPSINLSFALAQLRLKVCAPCARHQLCEAPAVRAVCSITRSLLARHVLPSRCCALAVPFHPVPFSA